MRIKSFKRIGRRMARSLSIAALVALAAVGGAVGGVAGGSDGRHLRGLHVRERLRRGRFPERLVLGCREVACDLRQLRASRMARTARAMVCRSGALFRRAGSEAGAYWLRRADGNVDHRPDVCGGVQRLRWVGRALGDIGGRRRRSNERLRYDGRIAMTTPGGRRPCVGRQREPDRVWAVVPREPLAPRTHGLVVRSGRAARTCSTRPSRSMSRPHPR